MHSYAYVADSRLDETRRALGLQTSGGRAPNPRFFTGFLADAHQCATALLAVAKVAGTRYFQPTPERLRDPVVTCDGDRLRFESFSGCCGVYARLDVLGEALDGEVHDRGTTNVDVNEPLRRALARVTKGDPLHLTVGPDQVEVGTLDGAVVEKKVPLPARWLRGFAETQVLTSRFDLKAELTAPDAQRFLKSLPKSAQVWAVPSGRTVRLSGAASAGAVCLAGPNRLDTLVPLLRFAKAVRLYGPPATGRPVASGWEVDLGAQRLTLVLSPEVNRGLSGEGAVLDGLAAGDADTDAELIGALLDFEPRVDIADLAERSGLTTARVKDALAQLGTAGRVGYDLAEAAYFHRELPYSGVDVQAMNPRLRNAKALVEQNAVRWDGDTALIGEYRVSGDMCTCRWWAEYRGGRGKCKHVLAADMSRGKA
ncbi:SWIM zinc finger family protein [Lentzea sp. NPDC051838]|uniref:SWIM zinc finger family protein n=1 Tax=Lentzea sp. NPDC051838 TaxID=3154849 RepID=UPI00341F43F2